MPLRVTYDDWSCRQTVVSFAGGGIPFYVHGASYRMTKLLTTPSSISPASATAVSSDTDGHKTFLEQVTSQRGVIKVSGLLKLSVTRYI